MGCSDSKPASTSVPTKSAPSQPTKVANPAAEKPRSSAPANSAKPAAKETKSEPAPKVVVAKDSLSISQSGKIKSIAALVLIAKLKQMNPEEQRQKCAQVIQRRFRDYMRAKEMKAEQTWQIFADLDAIEEKELLHLAGFMQILMSKVGATAPKTEANFDLDASTHSTASTASSLDSSLHGSKRTFTPMSVDLLAVAAGSSKAIDSSKEYNIPKTRKFDLDVVKEIIEVYRVGGKIHKETASRLLKKTYASIKKVTNTVHLTVPSDGKVTVVGDTHGSIHDVIHILEDNGLPSPTNKIVFNGDYVDRGKFGCEVALLLFAVYTADPENVVLNRGNHEDGPINTVYGFQEECMAKYDEETYNMFIELFRFMPLFTIINQKIFIVHGGLFNNRDVKLADLDKIDRIDYIAQPTVPYPECIEGKDAAEQWSEYYKQLQRDALWSDPQIEPGLVENKRGSGVHFGPDVAQTFLDNNNLSMIIRSHECVRRGFYLPFEATAVPAQHKASVPLLVTLFSASNYGNGDNEGCYLVLMNHSHTNSYPAAKSGLHYSLSHYKTSSTGKEDIERNNKSSLAELILKKKPALNMSFEAVDVNNTGLVSRVQWADVMQRVTTMKIRWLGIIATIVPAECMSGSNVDYRKFLSEYSVSRDVDGAPQDSNAVLDSLYSQRKILETIFHYFDTNGDGEISREEFRVGCALINENLPPGQQLTDIEHTLDVMDFDGNGVIDLNEFFETFRILDSKGKM